MRTDVLTKLPLATWAQMLGIYPLHFGGVALESEVVRCTDGWFQQNWQDFDRTSREEVAEAIARAEADIEHELGYRLLPTWEQEEWSPTVRPVLPELFNLNARNLRAFGTTVETEWHWMISGGRRESTVIEEGSTITWSDTRAPAAYEDLGTVTSPALDADVTADEVRVYYPGHDGDERWRIRPISVSIDSATLIATITFDRHLVIAESFMTGLALVAADDSSLRPANGTEDADFISEVDIYWVRNDPSEQVTLQWEPGPEASRVVTDYATQTGSFILRGGPRLSNIAFFPGTWNATLERFDAAALSVGRIPDSLRLWYYAGLRDRNQASPIDTMDPDWARTVAIYSASMLDRTPCQCSTGWWERWSQDMAFLDGATELGSYNLSSGDLDNPFGTRRGAIYAWKRVNRSGAAIGRSASLIPHA